MRHYTVLPGCSRDASEEVLFSSSGSDSDFEIIQTDTICSDFSPSSPAADNDVTLHPVESCNTAETKSSRASGTNASLEVQNILTGAPFRNGEEEKGQNGNDSAPAAETNSDLEQRADRKDQKRPLETETIPTPGHTFSSTAPLCPPPIPEVTGKEITELYFEAVKNCLKSVPVDQIDVMRSDEFVARCNKLFTKQTHQSHKVIPPYATCLARDAFKWLRKIITEVDFAMMKGLYTTWDLPELFKWYNQGSCPQNLKSTLGDTVLARIADVAADPREWMRQYVGRTAGFTQTRAVPKEKKEMRFKSLEKLEKKGSRAVTFEKYARNDLAMNFEVNIRSTTESVKNKPIQPTFTHTRDCVCSNGGRNGITQHSAAKLENTPGANNGSEWGWSYSVTLTVPAFPLIFSILSLFVVFHLFWY